MHFIYLLFPEVRHSDKQTPAEKHETWCRFNSNNSSIFLIFFSNQLTNLEMSFTADKCCTVELNPPSALKEAASPGTEERIIDIEL